MTIRLKVAALVALLFGLLIAVEGVIEEFVLMPRFLELERQGARTSMRRAAFALDRTTQRLLLNDEEWSNWGELYQYMQDFNPAFIATYTTAEAMTPLKANVLMLVDRHGTIVFSAARDLESGTPLDLDLAQAGALPGDFPWRENLASGTPARGLLRTNHGVLMLAAAPIFNGSGGGEALGMTLMGRLLTQAQIDAIGTQAQTALSMHPLAAANLPDLVEEDTVTHVSRRLMDIHGQPVTMLQVDVPRSITSQARTAILYSTLNLFAAAVTILVLLLVVLNRLILKRITRVTEHAVAMAAGGDLTARLNFAGTDEIDRLACEFDRMVGRLDESRRLRADQSFQAGFAERARGIMHNLGNAMTPLAVRLSLLAGRLTAAPLTDVTAAADELAGGGGEPERRRDLAQFVRFGCEHVEKIIAESHADIAVIERQVSIVTATLAEQRASAGNEQLLESVRLPDLLAQTLDIVPDACRRRLVVQIDESWRSVGVVTVARTVLRLVLQNLIINAADAVREAGLAQGALHLAAQIESADGRSNLHIQCRDNGIGIAPEHLKRVFDKGFSTKSRSTNDGIGLHWCASAIRSLGGRMWAASDGPGHGASLHVLFPMSQDGSLSYGG